MPVLALGVSHRRSPVELLERLSFGEDDFPKAYQRLRNLGSTSEGVVISTCNRVEVYGEVDGYHGGFQDLKRFLAEATDVPIEEFSEPLYSHYEDHAAEHLFSVAAGLDSMVLGEPQILSQVRAAIRRAEAEEAAGPQLGALFRRAVRTGRRVRAETAIGASPAAFVEAGAVLAAKHLDGLEGRSALVVGAGKMGALSIRALRDRGVGEVVVLGRRPHRAQRLAARTGVGHGTLEDLGARLGEAHLVVSSTGAAGTVLRASDVAGARDGRSDPLFILDLAVPRDVDPEAGSLPGVAVADIDDLRQILAGSAVPGPGDLEGARGIVAEETSRYSLARKAARVAPVIEALHARGEEVRTAELRRMASRLQDLSDRERDAVEALSRGIVKKLLHDPVVTLKHLAGSGTEDSAARVLVELFELDLPED